MQRPLGHGVHEGVTRRFGVGREHLGIRPENTLRALPDFVDVGIRFQVSQSLPTFGDGTALEAIRIQRLALEVRTDILDADGFFFGHGVGGCR